MNIFVKSILEPIGIPVSFVTNTEDANEYIIYNFWTIPGLHADDQEIKTNYTVQIDIFVKVSNNNNGNFISIENEVKKRMKDAGFMRVLENPAEFIDDTKYFRKTIRFSYTKEENK